MFEIVEFVNRSLKSAFHFGILREEIFDAGNFEGRGRSAGITKRRIFLLRNFRSSSGSVGRVLLRPESCVFFVGEAEGVSARMDFFNVTSAVFGANLLAIADTERRGATVESASGAGSGSRARAVFLFVTDGGTEAATEGTALVEVASGTDGVLSGRRHRRVDLVVEGFVLLFLWTFLFMFIRIIIRMKLVLVTLLHHLHLLLHHHLHLLLHHLHRFGLLLHHFGLLLHHFGLLLHSITKLINLGDLWPS